MVGEEETQKAAVQRRDTCQELANAFALLPLHMLPSYEGGPRSLPPPPPNWGSAGPSQEVATRHCTGGSNLLYPAPSLFSRGLAGTLWSLWRCPDQAPRAGSSLVDETS